MELEIEIKARVTVPDVAWQDMGLLHGTVLRFQVPSGRLREYPYPVAVMPGDRLDVPLGGVGYFGATPTPD